MLTKAQGDEMDRASFRTDPDTSSIYDRADETDLHAAREELKWRIVSGKRRVGVFELLESEVNQEPSCRNLLSKITDLLLDEEGQREALADQIRDGLVERYIDAHPELVEEIAEEE